jgi:hypothetical protein
MSPSRIAVCESFAGQDLSSHTVLRQLAQALSEVFQQNFPQIKLIELFYTSEHSFYAVLDVEVLHAVLRKVPARIANCPVGYLREKDMPRPQGADLLAKRLVMPQPDLPSAVVDDTTYATLRPGVVIRSSLPTNPAFLQWYATTSGVLVKNSAGDVFMTAASHGIGPDQEIWQGGIGTSGRSCGRAVVEITHTDISLVRLYAGIAFANEPFEDAAGNAPQLRRLFGEDPQDDRRKMSGFCYLDSPYTGRLDGVVVMYSVKFVHSNLPAEHALRYVLYDWAFLGQDGQTNNKYAPPDSTCGSAIWNDDGVVLGFYHYYNKEGPFQGFAATESASEVVNAGYSLA